MSAARTCLHWPCPVLPLRPQHTLSLVPLRLAVCTVWSPGYAFHRLPFQLNPNAPAEGVNKLESYKEKFGARRVEQMVPQMTVKTLP